MIQYLDFEDLKDKLGYKTYKPRIGNLGRALIQASKREHHRSIGWLKHQLDELFKKQRLSHKKESINGNKK